MTYNLPYNTAMLNYLVNTWETSMQHPCSIHPTCPPGPRFYVRNDLTDTSRIAEGYWVCPNQFTGLQRATSGTPPQTSTSLDGLDSLNVSTTGTTPTPSTAPALAGETLIQGDPVDVSTGVNVTFPGEFGIIKGDGLPA